MDMYQHSMLFDFQSLSIPYSCPGETVGFLVVTLKKI